MKKKKVKVKKMIEDGNETETKDENWEKRKKHSHHLKAVVISYPYLEFP